ncbi:helix-turn-helix transcriptional regulator [Micromonospora sp. NPDC048170]|uniref:PadR family transcriptional regulator n=1 Tax=Micromonospora sp. NPDC048170 TaxID=3154819 RepID=UPI0033F2A8FE
MTAVFSHGRLRLYLLKLLDGGPKHGYELIRLLEERFLGLYAPSAGTVYPRLQRLEADGLLIHTAAGGRKVYEITEAGRAELRQRAGELTALESDIAASVEELSALAGEIQSEVRGSVRDLKRELREATRQTRRPRWAAPGSPPAAVPAPGLPPVSAPGLTPALGMTLDPGLPPASGMTPGPGMTPASGVASALDPASVPGPAPASDSVPVPGPSAESGSAALAEFDQRLAAFVVEAGALVQARRLSDAQLRTAVRLLDGALDGLRRLLR